ncbi:protein of unknown function [Rhodovastum atsumiense]|nr:protein of unknown function [Rhodovastum atsumiense]
MSPGSAVSGPDAATATEPPPPSPALAPATISGIWAAAVAAWVQRHKSYPEEARRNGQEGRATVRITIRRDGTVLEAALLQATGADVLDHAVMTMLRGARLPPFPDGMPQPQVSVTIPIAYMLGR